MWSGIWKNIPVCYKVNVILYCYSSSLKYSNSCDLTFKSNKQKIRISKLQKFQSDKSLLMNNIQILTKNKIYNNTV